MKKRTTGIFLAGLLFCIGWTACTAEDLSSGDDENSGTDGDADGDSDGDADGDSDGDADGDTDGDGDTEEEEIPCDEYPKGPYDWTLETALRPTNFPAMYGPDGEEQALDLCDVYANRDQVKALVFAVTSVGCEGCVAVFNQLGKAHDQIVELNSEIVGMFYEDLESGETLPPVQTSEKMDEFGWEAGWRISDSAERLIWNGGCPDCLFRNAGFFIVETETMQISKYQPIGVEDIIAELERLNDKE